MMKIHFYSFLTAINALFKLDQSTFKEEITHFTQKALNTNPAQEHSNLESLSTQEKFDLVFEHSILFSTIEKHVFACKDLPKVKDTLNDILQDLLTNYARQDRECQSTHNPIHTPNMLAQKYQVMSIRFLMQVIATYEHSQNSNNAASKDIALMIAAHRLKDLGVEQIEKLNAEEITRLLTHFNRNGNGASRHPSQLMAELTQLQKNDIPSLPDLTATEEQKKPKYEKKSLRLKKVSARCIWPLLFSCRFSANQISHTNSTATANRSPQESANSTTANEPIHSKVQQRCIEQLHQLITHPQLTNTKLSATAQRELHTLRQQYEELRYTQVYKKAINRIIDHLYISDDNNLLLERKHFLYTLIVSLVQEQLNLPLHLSLMLRIVTHDSIDQHEKLKTKIKTQQTLAAIRMQLQKLTAHILKNRPAQYAIAVEFTEKYFSCTKEITSLYLKPTINHQKVGKTQARMNELYAQFRQEINKHRYPITLSNLMTAIQSNSRWLVGFLQNANPPQALKNHQQRTLTPQTASAKKLYSIHCIANTLGHPYNDSEISASYAQLAGG